MIQLGTGFMTTLQRARSGLLYTNRRHGLSTPTPTKSLPVPPDTRQAVDVGIVQPRSVASYSGQMQARGARTMPIILGTNGTIHEESRKHLEYLGVDIPKFMACAIFVIEYQHHRATADYMARASSGLKGKTAAATDGRPSAEGGPPGDPRCLPEKTEATCTSLKGKQPPQAAPAARIHRHPKLRMPDFA